MELLIGDGAAWGHDREALPPPALHPVVASGSRAHPPGGCMCLLALLLIGLWPGLVAGARAATWTVNPGDDVQQLLELAHPGDRVRFRPGHYLVHLRIDRPLVLEGEPGAVLDGGGKGRVIVIDAPSVVVRGLEIRRSGTGLTAMDAGIFVTAKGRDVRIENNRLDAVLFGIWLDGSKGAVIRGNRVHGLPALRSQDRGNGIHLHNTSGTLVADNVVWETRDGIYIETSNDNTLRDNDLHDLRYGIHYMFSNHNEVVGNRTRRTRTGYALMQSSHLVIRDNRSTDDANYGILMNYINYSIIAGNVIVGVHAGRGRSTGGMVVAGAEGRGLFIYNSQLNEIHDNVIAGCDIGIFLTAGSEDNRFRDNSIIDNRLQVKYVSTRKQEWSYGRRGNYWSDYLGWDLDGDGIGDRPYLPYDGVDLLLWRYPQARWLLYSPVIEVLHWVQRLFPLLRPPGVQDSHPLMKPANDKAIPWIQRSS